MDMVKIRRTTGYAVFVLGLLASRTFAQDLRPVTLADLCVTNGEIVETRDAQLHVETPSSRAVLRSLTDAVAEIRFRYLGPSAGAKPLASGELRRQIGLKLRAQDTCNLIYAMWHIAPDARIAVLIKRNPGMKTHEQCGAGGYVNVASIDVAARKIVSGDDHTLRAELRESRLTVSADGAVVWSGDLGGRISGFVGPVGMRTDNARFDFTFLAGDRQGEATTRNCVRSAGD
jgi:hypothetical protein